MNSKKDMGAFYFHASSDEVNNEFAVAADESKVGKFKRYNKYIVLKIADINQYLTEDERLTLHNLSWKIQNARAAIGKEPNSYVVVNQDMPYANKVWELIQKDWEDNQ